jgi:hypothetical protein
MNGRKDNSRAGDSDMARSFGAAIGVNAQSDGVMSLVVAHKSSPKALIRGVGGKVVMELSPTTILATLSPATHLSLRKHPDLRFVGPVTLDPARYAQFVSVLQQRNQPRET